MKTALIIGASGLTGGLLLHELLQSDHGGENDHPSVI